MRFLIDMPLSPHLAEWLNAQSHDAVHAVNVGLGTSPDADIIERARRDERIILPGDLDYPRLLALTQAKDPGLVSCFEGETTASRKQQIN